MKYIIIIPARYSSVRFPGKPLALIGEKPMIWHVYNKALLATDNVWVATDNEQILSTVHRFGGKAILTSAHHQSGTDRCKEAFEKIGSSADVVVNIQGDEPFISPAQIEKLTDCFQDKTTQIATLARPFTKQDGFESLFNPNHVKVNFNLKQEAIYFSRAILPYVRNYPHTEWLNNQTFYKHIGMYAYRTDILNEITSLPPSTLEKAESLEQLRWIENGYRIKIAFTNEESIGIDTPDDIQRAIEWLAQQKK